MANIRVTTRRGEAKYHASLFYDNKNSALMAWNLRDKIGQANFAPTAAQSSYPNPYFNLNEFGGSFGGPIPKLKNTYFFAAYERRYQNAPIYIYLGSYMSGLISGTDYNLIRPSDQPFGTTTGDGVTACSPDDGDCAYSPADLARLPFPQLGTYLIGFGNFGHGRTHAFQAEVNRRFRNGFVFTFSYTLLDQKSTAADTGNSSLGGTAYNQFPPESDYGMDGFTSRHRVPWYGIWDAPIGRGRAWGSRMPRALDIAVGGWQLSWQGFWKSGTQFTPFWLCDNCEPVTPGNIGSGSIDATGGFYGTSFRPVVTGNPMVTSGDRIWDPAAFGLPPIGAGLFDNPQVAQRNSLFGPGTYGLNLGMRKVFRFTERLKAELGADFNNILNHPLKSPDNYDIGVLGNFSMRVNPTTLRPEYASVTPNPDFGRLITSFTQEGVDSRRTIRLRLRISF